MLFFFNVSLLYTQQAEWLNNKVLEGRYHYGFLLPHHSSIEYSVQGHIFGYELNLLEQSSGLSEYDALMNYPRKGYGVSYHWLNNKEVFGSVWGFYGLYDVPIIREEKFKFTYRIYGGLSYLTKIYDVYDNYLQTAIGTHFNLYFRLCFDVRYQIGKQLEMDFNTGFTHFSNGNVTEPNLGLNLVTSSLAFNYSFQPIEWIPKEKKKIPVPEKINIGTYMAGGIKSQGMMKNERYFKGVINIHTGYNFSIKRQAGVGLDIFYDGTVHHSDYVRYDESTFLDTANVKPIQAGGIIYHDLHYGNLILSLQIGAYFLNKKDEYALMYNRTGLKFRANKPLRFCVMLKSHKTQADYIEFGIEYEL